jgi:metal-responsive CopG/Arc/MetJ family transcriptional regulator
MKKEKSVRLNISLSVDLLKTLEELTLDMKGITRSEAIRVCIRNEYDRVQKKKFGYKGFEMAQRVIKKYDERKETDSCNIFIKDKYNNNHNKRDIFKKRSKK